MRKKAILSLTIFTSVAILSGCAKTAKEKEEGVINPLSPSSMVNTYDNSKEKINDTVQKQNENINKALESSGINE